MPLQTAIPELRRLAPQIDLLALPDPRFKRAWLQLAFDRPLDDRAPARTLLTQLLEQGTSRLPTRMDLTRELEALFGARLALHANRRADGQSFDVSMGWVGETFLPPGSQTAQPALQLLREVLEDPLRGDGGEPFPVTSVERERHQLVRRIESMKDDRSLYAHERFLAAMCRDEPCGRAPYGTVEEVEALTGGDLEDARTDVVGRGHLTAVAVGAIDSQQLEEALRGWFGEGGPHGTAEREPIPTVQTRTGGDLREVHEALEVDQARFLFGMRFPPPRTPAEMEAQTLANAVFGGGAHGRLFRIVREQRSLAYGIYSQLRVFKGILTVSAGIDAGSFEEVRDEVLKQIEVMASGGFEDGELDMARANLLNDLDALGDTAARLAHFHDREHRLGFRRSPAQRSAQLQDVTRDDVCRMAAQWKPDLVYLLAADPVAATAGAA